MLGRLKSQSPIALLLMTASLLLVASAAMAGPIIEFGDNGGFLKFDIKGQFYVETTSYGAGPTLEDTRSDMHFQRLRISALGMLNETWGYKFQTCGNVGTTKLPIGYTMSDQDVDANARDIRIIDSYAIGNFSPAFNMKVGLTKIPVTRANLDDCFAPLTLDRSNFVYNAYGTSAAKFSRDEGIVFHGNLAEDHLKYFLGMFQGREGQSAVANPMNGVTYRTTMAPSNTFEYTARVHYSFLEPEAGAGYVGTHFGDAPTLTIGLGMAYQADAAYRNVSFNPTDGFAVLNDETVAYTEYAADLFFEYPTSAGTPTVNLQYLKADFDDAYLTNQNPGDQIAVVAGMNGQKEGGYGKLAWILPGTIGDEGLLQPYVISEQWDFAAISGVRDQTIKQYGGGINYYVHRQGARFTVEYLQTDFDKASPLAVGPGNILPNQDGFGTFRTMLQVVF